MKEREGEELDVSNFKRKCRVKLATNKVYSNIPEYLGLLVVLLNSLT